ncbi:MAG: peptide deformylase [Alphaproteobacteria bacterium]|nr:peptide deformylase [Alphaproteobacteria bacterium]|tara:strand:- start:2282 stop:2794 length:513 start_codon:yes stop_codon:yes gene_type:complete
MAKLPIVLAPDPVLKQTCKPVEAVGDDVRQMLDDMLETMYAAPGIGLSAPQVADDRRLIVCDVAREDEPPQPYRMVNPAIVWRSADRVVAAEGCLSIPDHYAEVSRAREIRVAFLDSEGSNQEIEADGLLAACIQHEIDHLDGILFIDYLSSLKRNIILRKMQKLKRQQN